MDRYIVLLIISLLSTVNVVAATRTGVVGGTLGAPLTGTAAWTCTCIPTQNDDIVVPDGSHVQLAGPYTVNNGSIVMNGTSSMVITGDVTFNNNSLVTINSSATFTVDGDLQNKNNSGDITFNGTVDVNGTLTNNGTGSVITLGTGASLEVDDFVNNSGGVINFNEPVTLTVNNTCTNTGTVNDDSGAYTGCAQGVLPITLGRFIANTCDSKVCVEWTTLTEENFDYFSIERSIDGLNFDSVGEINGAGGDSEEPRDYYFTDDRPIFGTSYYRLRSTDFDGYTETFRTVTVFVERHNDFKIYPSILAGNELNIVYQSYEEDSPLLRIIDLSGKIEFESNLGFDQIISVPTDLKNGIYFVEIIDKAAIKRTRVILAR